MSDERRKDSECRYRPVEVESFFDADPKRTTRWTRFKEWLRL